MNRPVSPLQGGLRRTPRRRGFGRRPQSRRGQVVSAWRIAGHVVVGLVVAAAVLLGLTAGRAAGPSRSGLATRRAVLASRPRPTRSTYGTIPAPGPERVNIAFKRALRSGMLFNVETGRVLWERNPTQVLPIASLTKMMTALVVIAHSRPSDQVLITPQAVHFTGSGIGLLPLHKRVVELALLYGLLLPSGNDAAIALAQHVAGSTDGLIAMMNAKARALGLTCTHFTTVSGIVDQGNHSCAADLALLAHVLVEQPLLAQIVASRSAILPFPIKGRKLYLYNNNPLLIVGYPGADGVKTGYTTAAGDCLVATARRGSAWLGVVLLHSGDILDQAERLLSAGFAQLRRAT